MDNYYIRVGDRFFELDENKTTGKNIIEEIDRSELTKNIKIKDISCWIPFKDIKKSFKNKGFIIRSKETREVLCLMDENEGDYPKAFSQVCGSLTKEHRDIIEKELNYFI